MHRLYRFLWSALALVLFSVPSVAHAFTCTPSFPLEQNNALGWQGADAAYSIPLKDGRDVWIFGDTLYGTDRAVTGHDPRQVHNSLGISTCDAKGNWHLRYIVKHDKAGHAESYFSPSRPAALVLGYGWFHRQRRSMGHAALYTSPGQNQSLGNGL